MRLIHNVPFTAEEIEHFRQTIFLNVTHGLAMLLRVVEETEDLVISEDVGRWRDLLQQAPDLQDSQPFPIEYKQSIEAVWRDPTVQRAWIHASEATVPEKCVHSD